jgi:Zn-dependent peptidase ImmA (M78 family)/DNA-binding XRE family transcriptional regulator
MSKKELAEALHVSAQIVTSWEDESRKPSQDMCERIAFALGFPLSFFFGSDVRLLDSDVPTFRSRRSLKANTRDKAVASAALATEILSVELRTRFRFPNVDVPNLAAESPEAAAAIIRSQWNLGVGPIHNVVHLLESKGIEVYWLSEPVSSLDAFSLWRGDLPFVILNRHTEAGDRARFDAAHELGHLLLHRNEPKVDTQKHESEADHFASAFLLPAASFTAESPKVPILSAYLPLKRRWGASIQAMIRRGRDLGLFSEWHYERAMIELSKLGWRTKEPAAVPRERSLLHNMVFDSLAAKGVLPDSFAESLYLPYADMAELMPNALDHVPITKKVSEPTERVVEAGDLVLRLVE